MESEMDGARPKLNPKLELKMLEKSQERGQKGVIWEETENPAVGKFREVHPGSLAFQIQLGEQPKVGRPFSPQGWGALRPQLVTKLCVLPALGPRGSSLVPLPGGLWGMASSSPGKDSHPLLPWVAARLPCLLLPPSSLQPHLLLQIHAAFSSA